MTCHKQLIETAISRSSFCIKMKFVLRDDYIINLVTIKLLTRFGSKESWNDLRLKHRFLQIILLTIAYEL